MGATRVADGFVSNLLDQATAKALTTFETQDWPKIESIAAEARVIQSVQAMKGLFQVVYMLGAAEGAANTLEAMIPK